MALLTRCTALPATQATRSVTTCLPIGRPQLPRCQVLVPRATTDNQGDKKALRREEEPEEYWSSKSERKGANPLSDPLALIGLTAIFLPFALLLVAIATGLVDVSVYR